MDITLSEAIKRFNRFLKASGKSEHTVADYNNGLNKLVAFVGKDHPLADLASIQLQHPRHPPATARLVPSQRSICCRRRCDAWQCAGAKAPAWLNGSPPPVESNLIYHTCNLMYYMVYSLLGEDVARCPTCG